MKYLLSLVAIITAFGIQEITGQSVKHIIQQGQRHQVSGTDYTVKIPQEFAISEKNNDEFVNQEKGSVIRFVHVPDIPTARFLDSMTTKYFEAQKLRDVTETKNEEVTIFKGKFDIDQVPYIRAFYVIPYKGSTILGIANYPERLGEELETHYRNMIKHKEHE
jgi:hypothetical protein